jgi:F-box protein 11
LRRYDGARATLEANELHGNAGPNLLVTEGSDPLVLRNKIHSGDDAGVLIHQDGKGTLLWNNVFNNRTYGVAVLTGGAPTLRRNWLHGKRQGGLLVDEGGEGEVYDNDIEGNTKAGVTLRGAGCAPHLHHNRIYNGRDSGVSRRGTFLDLS